MLAAIAKELALRKHELQGPVATIYFGGGTPSLLTSAEIIELIAHIEDHFEIAANPEITLEANPDDLDQERIADWVNSPINRLSIGVQSFFEEDLKLMNRAHSAEESIRCLEIAAQGFDNISMDLIYGIPDMSLERWEANVQKALDLGVPHLSCYALTVEPNTALKKYIDQGIIPAVDDDLAQAHHRLLLELTEEHGYANYEFSNFAKPGFESRNNTAYWHGKPYLGIGPSAHSFDGDQRSWNVANNSRYIKAIEEGALPLEREVLTQKDKYNEYVMTRLRTLAGISLNEVEDHFGASYLQYLIQQSRNHLAQGLLEQTRTHLRTSKKGRFLSDGLASDLFLVNL